MQEASHSARPPVIAAVDVHKSYGTFEVLKGISLSASASDVISIIGTSGSGKSTFLRCLNFLEFANRGQFFIHGEEITLANKGKKGVTRVQSRQIQRLRSRLGMVFQGFNLWPHMTVLGNLTAAPIHVHRTTPKEAREKAEFYLSLVGLYAKRDEYPASLSGGQQQRAAIARALCIEPDAILFDEPTSALDPELVGEVLKVIQGLASEGRTMVIVTHEMRFARDVSSHVLFLENGKIEEEGPPAQIFESPKSERCRNFTMLHEKTK